MADAATRPLSIRDLKDAGSLADKRRELENLRSRDKIDWALNREFYKNNQWVFWNKNWPGGGRLETQPVDEGDKPHYKVRITIADLEAAASHWIAQLTKNRPIISGTPNSGSERDLKAAQMATDLWEYWWQPDQLALDQKLQTSLLDATLSQGYWHISWDKLAGKPLSFMVSPDGKPLMDWAEEDLDIYRDTLREHGEDPKQFEKTVMVGDIAVKPLPGENILLDPAARTFDDARYAIVIVNMDVDELQARWPRDKNGNSTSEVSPDAIPGDEAMNPQGVINTDQRPKSVRRVYYLYVRPGPTLPKGRHAIWIEGPDMILEDTDWQFPFNELPLVKLPGIEKPNSPLDIPRMTAARPLAKYLNRSFSQIVEHQNLTLKPQVLAATGSMEGRMTNEPGRTIFYNPVNGMEPKWRDIPGLPSYVFENMDRAEQKLDRLFNRMPTGRDQLPARIDSGGAIDLIHEATADQITPVIRRLEAALVRGGMLMIKLAQKYYIEPRLLKITGANGSIRASKFLNADLEGGFGLHAEAGSGLPRTRAGKQARIEFMLTNQLIDQRTALKFLDTADMTGLMAKMQASEEQAYRTIEKIKKGQPLNPVAYQQAMAAMQSGINPQTQQPFQSPDEAQQALMQAALQPMPHEDSQIHLDTLTSFMDSVEFEGLDPQLQNMFLTRYSLVMQQAASIAQMQAQMAAPVERPKVALQLKGTTSAPVAGEILREAGVQVEDEQVAEPPLETWVTDSIDKADQDDAGNDPLTQAEQMQSMQQSQQTHALKMAKAAHEVSLAGARADAAQGANAQADERHALEQSRAEQMHAESVRARQAQAKASAKPKGPVKSGG